MAIDPSNPNDPARRQDNDPQKNLDEVTRTPGQAEGESDDEQSDGPDALENVTRTPGQAEGESSNQRQIQREQRDSSDDGAATEDRN